MADHKIPEDMEDGFSAVDLNVLSKPSLGPIGDSNTSAQIAGFLLGERGVHAIR